MHFAYLRSQTKTESFEAMYPMSLVLCIHAKRCSISLAKTEGWRLFCMHVLFFFYSERPLRSRVYATEIIVRRERRSLALLCFCLNKINGGSIDALSPGNEKYFQVLIRCSLVRRNFTLC